MKRNAKSTTRRRRTLKKKVVSTVTAAGAAVAIQLAPGCYYIYPRDPRDYEDSGHGDSAPDHPIYYVMAMDAGPPRDAAVAPDSAALDAGRPPDAATDHPVYYIMPIDY